MHPRCDEDGDVDVRISFAQFSQELRHDDMARYGTSMVTGNNDASFFTFGQFAQFRAANGVSQSIGNEFFFRFRCFIFVSMGNENAGYLFIRQFKFDLFFAKRHCKLLHTYTPFLNPRYFHSIS